MKIKKFLEHSPIFSLYLSTSQIIDDFQRSLMKQEVHFLQGLILTAIFFEENDVRPFELSHEFNVDRSTLSHALRGLEKKGLVKRAMHQTDARGYVFSLTPAGKRKALILIKEFDRLQEGFEQFFGVKKVREIVNNINGLRYIYKKLTQ